MKKYELKNNNKGITLIALVVTIIVLLILAGISMVMLIANDGILNRTTEAKVKNTHAEVYEQLQLESFAYLTDKMAGTTSTTLIEYLTTKGIITEITGEEGKWQINVVTLLGSKQAMGNGNATSSEKKDVYLLEEQSGETGNINKKVATIRTIKLAATSKNNVIYKVVYYAMAGESEKTELGKLNDTITITAISADASEKLKTYFNDPNSYDEYYNLISNSEIDRDDLSFIMGKRLDSYYRYKDGNIYKVTWNEIRVRGY